MNVAATPAGLLVDSNFFIAAEDHGTGHVFGSDAADVVRLAQKLGFQVLISNGTRSDVMRARPDLRAIRVRQLQKYTVLGAVPEDPAVGAEFPEHPNANNQADVEVLSTFATGRAQWLVTNDEQMRARAKRAGLDNVLSISDAAAMLSQLVDPDTVHVPAVEEVEGYQVNLTAPMFDTLRADYDGFDRWWRENASSRRVVVLGDPKKPEGVAVLKEETTPFDQLQGHVLKVCTFKVAETVQGDKRGELLLRGAIDHARQKNLPILYMTVFPDKAGLLAFLDDFGFSAVPGATTKNEGELVMAKRLQPPVGAPALEPLGHAIAYGPGSARVVRAHAVPITKNFMAHLMPDVDGGTLFSGGEGCGNAIRKAYLCRANTGKVQPGDGLLFIRTGEGESQARAFGVVENVLRTQNPDHIVQFVGTRTVYSRDQIVAMCRVGPVLALLFRHDRALEGPILTKDLIRNRMLSGVPQTINQIPEEGVTWLQQQLDG